jgi:hypothetical protein
MTERKTMATKKRETSDRVSKIAAKVLAKLKDCDDGCPVCVAVSFPELKALAASCLNQDQTKGKRPAKRKAKRRG